MNTAMPKAPRQQPRHPSQPVAGQGIASRSPPADHGEHHQASGHHPPALPGGASPAPRREGSKTTTMPQTNAGFWLLPKFVDGPPGDVARRVVHDDVGHRDHQRRDLAAQPGQNLAQGESTARSPRFPRRSLEAVRWPLAVRQMRSLPIRSFRHSDQLGQGVFIRQRGN